MVRLRTSAGSSVEPRIHLWRKNFKSMPFIATYIVLAAGGLVNAAHLTFKHFKKKPLVCPVGHDCNTVVESRWGDIFGMRNEILGVIFFAGHVCGILITVAMPSFAPSLYFYLFLGAAAGLAFSIFLTLVQIFAIKNYCLYCLISAGITLLLFLNGLVLWHG